MTAQVSEILIYKGEEFSIMSEPLSDFLEKKPKLFSWESSACWRGYVGKWKILGDKLFLIDLDGNTENGKVGLKYLFANKKEVFAKWFSGDLTIPLGELIEYVHVGYASIFEKDLIITFSKGIITKQVLVNNKTEELITKSLKTYSSELDKIIKEK